MRLIKFFKGLFIILIITLMILMFNRLSNLDLKEKWDVYNKVIGSTHVEVIKDDVSVLNTDKIDHDHFILSTISSITEDSIKSNLEKSNVSIRFSKNNQSFIDAEIYFLKNEDFLTPENNFVNTLKNEERVFVIIKYKGMFKTKYMLIELTEALIEFIGNSVTR